MALISVIIPVYNHALELGDCLRFLEKQTFTDFEVIVVDDGSKDDLGKRFADYHGRFSYRFVRLETNQGAPVARNYGFQLSKGEYVLFLDADAVLQPNMLNELLQALQAHQEAGFAYSSFYFGRTLFRGQSFNIDTLKKMNYIHTSALIRRSVFPGFDPALKKFQDWDLWLTLAENGVKGFFVDEVLFSLKPRKTGMSQWLPSFMYRIPWPILGYTPRLVKKYREAEALIRKKHHI